MRYFFPKSARLCSPKLIASVFSDSDSVTFFPIRALWRTDGHSNEPIQVMFSVPKRNFKHAVHRNVLKRRMREAFRLNRSSVEAEWPIVAERGLVVVLIYIGRAELNYPRIEGAMRQIIRHICKNTIDSVNSLT